MFWNAIVLAFVSIKRYKLRSFLTILGIVIGIAAVIAMVTVGKGATKAITNQIASLGSNILMVTPKIEFKPGVTSNAKPFEMKEVELIREQIPFLRAVAPIVESNVVAVYGPNSWATSVRGTTNDYFIASDWNLAIGRSFTPEEIRSGEAVCIIGETVRKELFLDELPVGKKIRVGNFAAEIIGVLKPKGQGAMGIDQDNIIVMPIRTVQRRIVGSQKVNMITISIQEGVLSNDVMKQIRLLLRESRHISRNEEDDFDILDSKEIINTLSATTRTMTVLLGAVAAVSLIVGGIGIMNIMLVSVTERTREIGIRLAVGALPSEVMLQFMIEAITLSSIGGIFGIIISTIGSVFMTKIMMIPYVFSPSIYILSLLFSCAVGIFFGYWPAKRAARLDPIVALRYE